MIRFLSPSLSYELQFLVFSVAVAAIVILVLAKMDYDDAIA